MGAIELAYNDPRFSGIHSYFIQILSIGFTSNPDVT